MRSRNRALDQFLRFTTYRFSQRSFNYGWVIGWDFMPSGAFLINTSRGEIVDPAALAQALEKGKIAGAAIDTVSPEPPPADHPLLNLSQEARDRLLITPHMAGITKGAFNRMLSAGLDNIVHVVRGGDPRNVVNNVLSARKPG